MTCAKHGRNGAKSQPIQPSENPMAEISKIDEFLGKFVLGVKSVLTHTKQIPAARLHRTKDR